jgi:hypothetical protein
MFVLGLLLVAGWDPQRFYFIERVVESGVVIGAIGFLDRYIGELLCPRCLEAGLIYYFVHFFRINQLSDRIFISGRTSLRLCLVVELLPEGGSLEFDQFLRGLWEIGLIIGAEVFIEVERVLVGEDILLLEAELGVLFLSIEAGIAVFLRGEEYGRDGHFRVEGMGSRKGRTCCLLFLNIPCELAEGQQVVEFEIGDVSLN